jgi:hypothetical protein
MIRKGQSEVAATGTSLGRFQQFATEERKPLKLHQIRQDLLEALVKPVENLDTSDILGHYQKFTGTRETSEMPGECES